MVLLALLVGAGALAFTLLPLLRPDPESPPEPEAEHGADRLSEKQAVLYENIRDLDFEYAMGKLSEEDYREVRDGMVREAAGVLKEIDLSSRDEALDRWIEAEVKQRRGSGTRAAAAGGEAECPACRAANPVGARFCDGCGAKLGAACPGCGAGNRPGARFCGGCGGAL